MSAVRNSRTYDFDGVFHTCKCFVGLFSCTLNFLVHYVLWKFLCFGLHAISFKMLTSYNFQIVASIGVDHSQDLIRVSYYAVETPHNLLF